MFNFRSSKSKSAQAIRWQTIQQAEQLAEIEALSHQKKVLVFKHSTRCGISATALNRLERAWQNPEMEQVEPYLLDLIQYRALSDQIAKQWGVTHQSPQVIVLDQGEVVYHNSHMGINYQDLKALA